MSIYDSIITDMSEGLMTIGFDGVITHMNPAAARILGLEGTQVVGVKFARLFFDDEGKDEFVQSILEAVYDKEVSHHAIVPYEAGGETLHLRVMTSFYKEEEEKKGIIVVFSDLSELMELRDAVRSMERIQELNARLEIRNRLLSETFGRFLSDEIVKQLLDTPGGLSMGGKKRKLTIMMSDLRGFTVMSERMGAADLLTMLNHYLGCMTELIQKNKGTIIEFIGDGIMAVFGAPTPSESHAADAIAAAVGMQRAMTEINKWNEERGYPVLEMGIGLNTGEVIVGNIGSEKRTKYGVVGNHVNLCGRIESYTVGGHILIPPTTKEDAGVELQIEDEMVVRPKGVDGDLTLYRVTGIGGDYGLYIEEAVGEQLEETSIPVSFRLIEGKHMSADYISGEFCAVGNNNARLRTQAEIKVFDNLEMDAGGPLFCKVMKKDGDVYDLRYTSVSEGYESWKREKMFARS